MVDLVIPGYHRFKEFAHFGHTPARVGVSGFLTFGDTLPEHLEGRIDFAPLPLVQDDAEHLPDVLHRLEMVAPVVQNMDCLDDPPVLQFAAAGADVGAGDPER